MITVSDYRSKVCRFDSQPFHHQVTTLGKLFTHVPLSPSSISWYRPKCREGNSSMWERCSLPPNHITESCPQLTGSSGHVNRDED